MVGDSDLLTGGYLFNFRMVEALRGAGHAVDVHHYRTIPAALRNRPVALARHLAGSLSLSRLDLMLVSKSYKVMLPLVISGGLPRGVPLLYLVHHLEWRDRGLERGPLHRRMAVRYLLGRADSIWVNSRSTGADLASLGVDPGKLTAIPPGFSRPDRRLPDRRGREGPVTIVSVGAISERKAQIDLVRACAGLGERSFQLVLAGAAEADSKYARRLRREVRELGMESRVRVMGHLEREELYRQYEKADIMAQASHWEGYGIAVAEAMWMGLPVVATTGGATPEVLGDCGAGLMYPPGDIEALSSSLAGLIDGGEKRLAMGRAARSRAEALPDWEECSRRFVELASAVSKGEE